MLVTDVGRIRGQNTGDFEHFYYAADAMRRGMDPYAAHTRGYIYPPLIAFLFQPLSFLSRDQAAAVMLCTNVAATLLAVGIAVDEFLRRSDAPRAVVVIAALMCPALLLNIDKIKGEWQMWQTDVWMLFLFVMALRWIDRLPFLAGIALGIAINIKYIPLIFLPYLLFRRRWMAGLGLIAGTIVFALLPALRTGWSANARNWGTATNGILQMAEVRHSDGQPPGGEAAEVHDVKDSLSCSITSAMARASGSNAPLGFELAGAIAISFFAIAWLIYYRQGIGLFSPPAADAKLQTGVEWVMLIATALAFAPQTNTRHLFDALIFTSAATVLLVFPNPGPTRWPLLIGTAILFLGFILPPGNRTFHGELNATVKWLRIGGPCWCMMVAAFMLLWTGLGKNSHHGRPADGNSNRRI